MEVVVTLADGRELVVRLEDELVVIAVPGQWTERLSREEAWELAETIDLVSTARPDLPGGDDG